jgi:type IV secretion system protein VirB4
VLIAGSDGYQTTNEDDRNIFHTIEMLYVLEPDIRRLKTVAGTLPRHLADRLYKWIEGGQYGRLFDNTEDTLPLTKFQCFDFQGMDEYPQLIQALLFYVLHRASSVIYDPAIRATLKVFILDEAWKFFTVQVIRNYLVKAAKTWRKHNGVLIMATQSPEDLKESNLLPLLDSFPTKIFLANSDADYAFYTEKFHLNPREVELIQTLIPKREGLIKTSSMGKKFVLNVDRKSYWLYTNSRRTTSVSPPLFRNTDSIMAWNYWPKLTGGKSICNVYFALSFSSRYHSPPLHCGRRPMMPILSGKPAPSNTLPKTLSASAPSRVLPR